MNVPARTIEWDMELTYKNNKGGYCCWCGVWIEHLYIDKGIRKQKFCKSSCKNKCKDLRRGLDRPSRTRSYSENRFKKLSLEFVGDINLLGLKEDVKKAVIEIRKINV